MFRISNIVESQISSKQNKSLDSRCNKNAKVQSLSLDHGHTLGHEVEEGELARLVTVLVDETAGQVATEDSTQVVLGDLEAISKDPRKE